MSNATLNEIFKHHKKIQNLESISSLLYWDFETMMPKGSGDLRSDQLSLLNTSAHALSTDAAYVDKVMALDIEKIESGEDRKHITKLKKSLAKFLCIDESFIQRSTEAAIKCHEKWKEARETKSFGTVKDHLATLVALRQEYASRAQNFAALKPYYAGKNAYEILLDEYEPGISSEYLRTSLKSLLDLTTALLPSIESKDSGNTAPAPIHLATDKQHQIVIQTAAALGFDFTKGRIDKSVHPFCGGHPFDTRITTRYKEDDATDSVWSTIHETGHALYEQGLPAAMVGLPCGTAASMGVHESQSRFYENQIGKSLPFCQWIAPHFGVSAETLFANLNQVKKSLIRVDSDEVTYNLHIYLRFEIEEKLILGTLAVNDLEEAWNESVKRSLGLTPPSPLEGVLQDTHWYGGAFGYFPTYSLGNMLAAELFVAYQKEFPNWADLVSQGNFGHINQFMRARVHTLAGLEDSPGTMKKILGGRLPDPKVLTSYFRSKFVSD